MKRKSENHNKKEGMKKCNLAFLSSRSPVYLYRTCMPETGDELLTSQCLCSQEAATELSGSEKLLLS